jgi:hypothetical protein
MEMVVSFERPSGKDTSTSREAFYQNLVPDQFNSEAQDDGHVQYDYASSAEVFHTYDTASNEPREPNYVYESSGAKYHLATPSTSSAHTYATASTVARSKGTYAIPRTQSMSAPAPSAQPLSDTTFEEDA